MAMKALAPDGSGTKNQGGVLFRKRAIEEMDNAYIRFKTEVVRNLVAGQGSALRLYALSEKLPAQLRDALSVSIDFTAVIESKGEFE